MHRGTGSGGSPARKGYFALWVLIASLLLALLPPAVEAGRTRAPAAAQQGKTAPVAQVRYIKRGLAVKPPQKKQVKGKVKMKLFSRYGLATGRKQLASLGFKDGTVLR